MSNPQTVTATANLLAALSLDGKDSAGDRQVNGSALELLISELVNTLTLTTQETKWGSETAAQSDEPKEEGAVEARTLADAPKRSTGARSSPMVSGWQEVPDNSELMEQVYVKLELIGFRIGRRLAERFAPPNRRLTDTLDIVKFVCKDIWMLMFNRQIDNLKTNHRGIYVLQDNKFKWFLRMSGNNGGAAAARRAQPYIWLPCGIIRGVLDSYGVGTVVIAETLGLPQCTFQIKVVSDA
ncbi:hypothetical protein GGH94_001167 [Coemansia aciculifera]|uniref:Transport protein particle component n=1 Tax=Coemansia aciculifera TaxID=417176 RepID=A0A9W8IT56_9FUNG|nr:hypothetical protein GGH94_001167 [Coemansia aciculifera]